MGDGRMGAALGGSVRTGVRVERTPLPPHAHEHEGRPAGRKRGVQGGRCPSVGAAREAGRPGPWESDPR